VITQECRIVKKERIGDPDTQEYKEKD